MEEKRLPGWNLKGKYQKISTQKKGTDSKDILGQRISSKPICPRKSLKIPWAGREGAYANREW